MVRFKFFFFLQFSLFFQSKRVFSSITQHLVHKTYLHAVLTEPRSRTDRSSPMGRVRKRSKEYGYYLNRVMRSRTEHVYPGERNGGGGNYNSNIMCTWLCPKNTCVRVDSACGPKIAIGTKLFVYINGYGKCVLRLIFINLFVDFYVF